MIYSDLVAEADLLVDFRQRFFEAQMKSLELVFSLWQADIAEKRKLETVCWNLRRALPRNLFAREQFLLVVPNSRIPASVQIRGLLPNFDEPDHLEISDRWRDLARPHDAPYLILDPCARLIDLRWHQRYRQYWVRQMAQYGHVPMTLVEGITWLAHRHQLTHAETAYHCDYLILGTKGKGGRVIRILQGLGNQVKLSVSPWRVESDRFTRPQFLLTRKQQYHH